MFMIALSASIRAPVWPILGQLHVERVAELPDHSTILKSIRIELVVPPSR